MSLDRYIRHRCDQPTIELQIIDCAHVSKTGFLQVSGSDNWFVAGFKHVVIWLEEELVCILEYVLEVLFQLASKLFLLACEALSRVYFGLIGYDEEYYVFESLVLITFLTLRYNWQGAVMTWVLLVAVFGLHRGLPSMGMLSGHWMTVIVNFDKEL